MTRDEFKRRFNAAGTIGNGSDLVPVPRVEPVTSYHAVVLDAVKPPYETEVAIRYDRKFLDSIDRNGRTMMFFARPIFKQFPPEWSN